MGFYNEAFFYPAFEDLLSADVARSKGLPKYFPGITLTVGRVGSSWCNLRCMENRLVKLAFILFIPLLLLQIPVRYLYDIEPYPFILLPGGASVVKDQGFISIIENKIVASTAAGKRYEVDIHELLNSVPRQYRQFIVKRNFGLPSTADNHVQRDSDSRISVGRRWLTKRLGEILGRDDFVKLEIIAYRVTRPTTYLTSVPKASTLSSVEIQLQ